MACEKCWNDAYRHSLWNGKDQSTNYRELLKEREDTPCGPQYDSAEYFKLGGLGNPIEKDEELIFITQKGRHENTTDVSFDGPHLPSGNGD